LGEKITKEKKIAMKKIQKEKKKKRKYRKEIK
jgi:hypothetical protein